MGKGGNRSVFFDEAERRCEESKVKKIKILEMSLLSRYFRDGSCPVPDSRTSSNKDFQDRSLHSFYRGIPSALSSLFYSDVIKSAETNNSTREEKMRFHFSRRVNVQNVILIGLLSSRRFFFKFLNILLDFLTI
ncbi:hypothetical protein TNCT_409061 [Trichonephila clavata]|uniref:Uncharacterized protein n=1 Tax=Trichonephila clavata TaxID=2740835 RepID=A0A8X6LSJ8_TRICU|nr:hypothetical protein TNCT_409061 [Trichonephila clavata]